MNKILVVSLFDTEMFIGELSKRMSKRNFQVFQVCITKGYLKNINNNKYYQLSSNYKNPYCFAKNVLEIKSIVGKADIINYHFIHYSYILFDVIYNGSGKKIGSIWGGDLYKNINGLRKYLNRILIRRCDVITATNPKTVQYFKTQFPSYEGQVEKCTFGLSLLDLIDGNSSTFNFSIEANIEVVVCLGTNASKFQNHLAVLKSLSKLDPIRFKNVLFILPMTYPKNRDYINVVREELKCMDIGHLVIEKYMSTDQLVGLRRICQILIQVQDTDQFSGAMQEAIYAGAEVITGDWLPYEILEKKGIRLEKVSRLEEVGLTLLKVLDGNRMTKKEVNERKNVILELSSWNSTISKWCSLYSI